MDGAVACSHWARIAARGGAEAFASRLFAPAAYVFFPSTNGMPAPVQRGSTRQQQIIHRPHGRAPTAGVVWARRRIATGCMYEPAGPKMRPGCRENPWASGCASQAAEVAGFLAYRAVPRFRR
ncbi:hypothetical protein VTH06DRAFT_3988 [Thermothelomyces fergusii]